MVEVTEWLQVAIPSPPELVIPNPRRRLGFIAHPQLRINERFSTVVMVVMVVN